VTLAARLNGGLRRSMVTSTSPSASRNREGEFYTLIWPRRDGLNWARAATFSELQKLASLSACLEAGLRSANPAPCCTYGPYSFERAFCAALRRREVDDLKFA
jgi:hypothetical protein